MKTANDDYCNDCEHEKTVYEKPSTIHYECAKHGERLMCVNVFGVAVSGVKCNQCKEAANG